MAHFLSREAAQDYFHLILLSYEYHMIDESTLLERLVVLSSLGDPANGATVFANEILQDRDWPKDDNDWLEDTQGQERSKLIDNDGERSAEEGSDDGPDDLIIHFAIAVGGNEWKFHPFDDDWFPSVPHGHKIQGRPTDKLDPYLGWVYNRSKQSSRLKRNAIISLWNDEKFRKTALIAIEYYLEHHSHYRGWRVSNPRRLPRRR